jgi:RND superfamily putative drug exporter
VNRLLEGLGGFAARRHWLILIGWVIILGVVVGASHQWGGSYVNNYTVPGSGSQDGLNVLNASLPSQGGYGGADRVPRPP